ncbi:putative membrane protein [Sphingomonas sp. S17]|uniref:DUF3429 domain-containing protein n=2 Tax=Sphingomonas paucimobilis TaxID=13689 RepID=A0A411LJ27_SPHPI|nr:MULTISPECIES: DUF3429 domain-containing protein [Sphingomonas]EGI56459.1 putative membrane protein [Sphingomonas sp. S17]MBQ1478966.1 DUF3429 domain-containing protein [Sphingomonas sp.]MCM3678460.1 DUF3429 family protein [Sphingomonas paucimobilis]MDG5969487.1 hypothetical protein [Sphingomonas paucimobilis]NNG56096.1 DUF3429 domain-containing protein [Sphingomonas paucimobilis]
MTDPAYGPAPTPQDHSPRTPRLSLIFGYGPILVLPLAALGVWAGLPLALVIGQIWGAAILAFLAGVARGLSFFTPGGPHVSQMLTMILRFSLGLLALVASPPVGLALLLIGYASIAVTDPWLARWGGAPRHFARLRPPQMVVALVGLLALFLLSLH